MARVAVSESLISGAVCGCDAHAAARKAVAVDPEIKSANLKRLRRIEGQIRGLHKMVEEDRYCPDIIIQVSSVQEALRGVDAESPPPLHNQGTERRRRAGGCNVRRTARIDLTAFALTSLWRTNTT